jgi:hypothetical protein
VLNAANPNFENIILKNFLSNAWVKIFWLLINPNSS